MDVIQRNWKEVSCSSSAKPNAIHKWIPPPISSLKLNFHGSACGSPGVDGVGGIIQNDVGQPILSFSGPAGFNSANVVELLAIATRLRKVKRLNLHHVIIEWDSFCAIQWASGAAKVPWKVASVIGEISDLAKGIQVSFSHIYQSANTEADHLAKEGASRHDLRVILYPL